MIKLLIILVVALGILVLFVFGVLKSQEPAQIVDQQVQQLNTLNTSDEVGAIESDLDETDLDAIDLELSEVDVGAESL